MQSLAHGLRSAWPHCNGHGLVLVWGVWPSVCCISEWVSAHIQTEVCVFVRASISAFVCCATQEQ